MNNLLYIISFVALSLTGGQAQDWGKLFVSQDFDQLESNLSEDVTLKIGRDKKISARSKVVSQLKEKIASFDPVSYNSKHKGSSDSSENYYIAELVSNTGSKMRVFLHLENSADGRRICDIKIRDL